MSSNSNTHDSLALNSINYSSRLGNKAKNSNKLNIKDEEKPNLKTRAASVSLIPTSDILSHYNIIGSTSISTSNLNKINNSYNNSLYFDTSPYEEINSTSNYQKRSRRNLNLSFNLNNYNTKNIRPISSSPSNIYNFKREFVGYPSGISPGHGYSGYSPHQQHTPTQFSTNSYSSSSNLRTPLSSAYLPNKNTNKKTLILDLDETLVHSSFKSLSNTSDFVLRVVLERRHHTIHVLKRPGVEEFLDKMSKHYEVVIFTASLSPYANPLIDQLDKKKLISYRLFREHCTSINGMFIKDMKKLGRDLKDVIIIDVRNY